MSLEEMAKPRHIEKDLSGNPESDSGQFISVIIESLNQLDRLPDATEVNINMNPINIVMSQLKITLAHIF